MAGINLGDLLRKDIKTSYKPKKDKVPKLLYITKKQKQIISEMKKVETNLMQRLYSCKTLSKQR